MSQSIEEGEQDWAVWTDRTFYISGEKIQFTAISKQPVKSSDNESDKVLYCELLSAEGAQMVGGKFPVKQGRVTGSLTIPEKTFSGYYLLSFYTKRMRIGTSAVFPGIRLKILHPEIVDVLTVEANIPQTDSLSKLKLPQEQSQYVSVSTEHAVYQPDDSIRIKVSFTGKVKPDFLNLSIVPEFSYQPQHKVIQKLYFTDSVRNLLPDTRGVSISGVIIDKLTKQPIQGIRVSATIIGEKDVMARKTDESGFFCFALPDRYGLKDLFLCTEKREGKQPEIFIDNDFSPGKRRLPVGELRLDSAESVLALNLIRNYKISNQYYPDTAMNPVTNSFAGIPFYGSKSEKLIMESYIELPTVEDYFREIPVMMNVRKSEGKKVFRFINTKPEMSIYEPMVLIDWVMVDDIESLLAISPSVIDRVELVNDIYIKGDIIYGGIISFISKKNDFAGIKLPPNGKFINYQFFTELGKKELDLSRNMHLPDSRNTLLWIPQISYNEGIETILRTKAPASSGKYLILVRGIGADMKEFEISSSLEIIAK
ncbi:MAG: hypothetical protein IPH84_15140 [Bacteroidales bacterium]|nr:hypothetical protein [Bacteroidales bacterium]